MVEGFLLRHVTDRVGERRIAILVYVAGAFGYGLLAVTLAGWAVTPAIVLIALGGLATPSVRAMMSGRGETDHQGQMQGLLSAVEGLTAIVAPLLTAGLFFAFTSRFLPVTFPGAPFAFAAASAVLAVVLLRNLD